METLAYIHSAQASEIDASQLDWQLHPRYLPSLNNWIKILSIPLTLAMIANTTDAFALLRRGDSGAEVVQLQDQLKSLGYFQARSTGFFASHTLEVVTKFQADHGLPQDGIVGQETQAAIDSLLGSSSITPVPLPKDTTADHAIDLSLRSNIVGNLTLGTTGVAVSTLQDDLRVVGFYTAATTGIYDQATETAVINFQKSQGLIPDGIAGTKTLTALAKLGGVAPTNPGTAPVNPSNNPAPKTSESRGPLNPTITLQLDSRGEDVRTLQMKLAQLGYYTGGITGVFEDKTQEAVVRFQKDRGLNPDGLVKANTWEELAAQ